MLVELRRMLDRVAAPAFVTVALFCSAPANGQEPTGIWDDPIDLSASLIKGTGTATYPTREIAHAAVLPPASEGNTATRVLLVCVPQYPQCTGGFSCATPSTSTQQFGRSYIWKPTRNDRMSVSLIPPPSNYPPSGSNYGSQDFFCAGQTFLADGRLMWVGGSNYKATCELACGSGFVGHEWAWFLDSSGPSPDWWDSTSAVAMTKKRWYPSAVTLNNGDVFVMGHTLLPNDAGANGPGNNQNIKRDEYSASSGTFSERENDAWAANCSTDQTVIAGYYPRVHLLRNGQLMQSIAIGKSGSTIIPLPTRFLDARYQQHWPSCGSNETDFNSHPEYRRWKTGGSGSTSSDARIGANSVHLITWHGSVSTNPPDTAFTEVVYIIGGSTVDAEGDDCGTPSSIYYFLNTVERMVDPHAPQTLNNDIDIDPGSSWESMDAMDERRVDCNTVILADGSLLAVGGVNKYGSQCHAALQSERYEPEEVFGNANPTWEAMAFQQHKRGYHSIACLLPDGSVVSAGGFTSGDTTMDSEQSLEQYYPPYLYPSTGRPDVNVSEVAPQDSKDYLQQLDFHVTVKDSSTTVNRIVLIRNSSVTHAFDTGQRYVHLAKAAVFTQSDRSVFVHVMTPNDGFYAPPGYYMLFAIDSHQRPSDAVWLHLEEQ